MDHRIKIFVILLGCRGFEPMTLLTSIIQIGKDPGEDYCRYSCVVYQWYWAKLTNAINFDLRQPSSVPFFWRFKSGEIGNSVWICQSWTKTWIRQKPVPFLKMGWKCCVPGCKMGYKEGPPNLSMHAFPIDPGVRQDWIRAILFPTL